MVPVLAPISAPPSTWKQVVIAAAPSGRSWKITVTVHDGSNVTVDVPSYLTDDAFEYLLDAHLEQFGEFDFDRRVDSY